MSDVSEFVDKAIREFRENLTDGLFLFIENDRELMQRYLELMEAGHSRKEIHSQLGKQVVQAFSLTNQPISSARPRSSLITTEYRLHE
jgi:hypothetical protein